MIAIVPYQKEVGTLQQALAKQVEVSDRLRRVRAMLLSRTKMQEQRILLLEERLAMEIQINKTHAILQGRQSLAIGVGENNDTATDRNNSNVVPPLASLPDSPRKKKSNILAILDDNSHDDSIYFEGDDTLSETSKHSDSQSDSSTSAKHSLPKQTRDSLGISRFLEAVEAPNTTIPVTNHNRTCSCQTMLLSSNKADDIEFYLPRLNFSCRCGRHKPTMTLLPASQNSVALVLRPWQSEFLLTTKGIAQIQDFLTVCSTAGSQLAIEMVQWRQQKGLHAMPQTSCSVALLIWCRTCVVATRARTTTGMT